MSGWEQRQRQGDAAGLRLSLNSVVRLGRLSVPASRDGQRGCHASPPQSWQGGLRLPRGPRQGSTARGAVPIHGPRHTPRYPSHPSLSPHDVECRAPTDLLTQSHVTISSTLLACAQVVAFVHVRRQHGVFRVRLLHLLLGVQVCRNYTGASKSTHAHTHSHTHTPTHPHTHTRAPKRPLAHTPVTCTHARTRASPPPSGPR